MWQLTLDTNPITVWLRASSWRSQVTRWYAAIFFFFARCQSCNVTNPCWEDPVEQEVVPGNCLKRACDFQNNESHVKIRLYLVWLQWQMNTKSRDTSGASTVDLRFYSPTWIKRDLSMQLESEEFLGHATPAVCQPHPNVWQCFLDSGWS